MLHNVKAFRVFGHHMGHFAVQLTAGHVVDDLRTMLQRHASHRCARSVDGQHRAFRNQRIHSTQHAVLLVFLTDTFGSGASGFGTDIDDVSPIFHHRFAVRFRIRRVEP